MSFWNRPTEAAKKAVVAPMKVTNSSAKGDNWNRGEQRQTRNTPSVTMVAAWISAETGVGPSMASGSQVCSGTWADLANAPTSSSTQPTTSEPWSTVNAESRRANVCRKSSVCTPRNTKYVPSTSPTSPATLMTNALMPAAV